MSANIPLYKKSDKEGLEKPKIAWRTFWTLPYGYEIVHAFSSSFKIQGFIQNLYKKSDRKWTVIIYKRALITKKISKFSGQFFLSGKKPFFQTPNRLSIFVFHCHTCC